MQSVVIADQLPAAVAAALGDVPRRLHKEPILRFGKFGRNSAIGTSAEILSLTGGSVPQLQAADQVKIAAGGNAADTSDGDGAREVTIWGINDELDLDSDVLVTAGASASAASTKSFWRLYRGRPTAVGVYGAANTDAIEIQDDAETTTLLTIGALKGSTQFGGFATPRNYFAIMANLNFYVDATEVVSLEAYIGNAFNTVSAPFGAKQLVGGWNDVENHLPIPEAAIIVPPLCDFWFEGIVGQNTGAASVNWDVYLVPVRTD